MIRKSFKSLPLHFLFKSSYVPGLSSVGVIDSALVSSVPGGFKVSVGRGGADILSFFLNT